MILEIFMVEWLFFIKIIVVVQKGPPHGEQQ